MQNKITGRFKPGNLLGLSGKKRHPLTGIWCAMMYRCNNPKDNNWQRYGGRGIKVCERWMTFANFYADMVATYRPGFSIERKENDGNYEPGNCKWIPRKEQAKNRCNSIKVTFLGVEKNLYDFATDFGLNKATVFYRFHNKWPLEQVFGFEKRPRAAQGGAIFSFRNYRSVRKIQK